MKTALLQVRQRAGRQNKNSKLNSAKSRRTIPVASIPRTCSLPCGNGMTGHKIPSSADSLGLGWEGFAWLVRPAHATARKPARALLQSFQIGGDRRS